MSFPKDSNQIELLDYQGTALVKIRGSILQENSIDLSRSLEALSPSHNQKVIVDLSDVNHICSSALGVLVSFKRRIRQLSGDIKIVVVDEDIKQLFEITLLDKVFDLYGSLPNAMSSFE